MHACSRAAPVVHMPKWAVEEDLADRQTTLQLAGEQHECHNHADAVLSTAVPYTRYTATHMPTRIRVGTGDVRLKTADCTSMINLQSSTTSRTHAAHNQLPTYKNKVHVPACECFLTPLCRAFLQPLALSCQLLIHGCLQGEREITKGWREQR